MKPFSEQLIQTYIKYERSVHNKDEASSKEAQLAISRQKAELIPSGIPDYKKIFENGTPMVYIQKKEGENYALKILVMLLRDLAASFNVVRNLNGGQMLELAKMMLNECGPFRLEDFIVMFELGKRGELVDIRDRIDINIISKMMDAYWYKFNDAWRIIREEKEKKIFAERQYWHRSKHLFEYAVFIVVRSKIASISAPKYVKVDWSNIENFLDDAQRSEQEYRSRKESERRRKEREQNEKISRFYAQSQGVDYDEVKADNNREWEEYNKIMEAKKKRK